MVATPDQFYRNDPRYLFCGCIHSETAVLVLSWIHIILTCLAVFAAMGHFSHSPKYLNPFTAFAHMLALYAVYKSKHRYLLPILCIQIIQALFFCYVMIVSGIGILDGSDPLKSIGFSVRGIYADEYVLMLLALVVFIYFCCIPYIRVYKYLADKRASQAVHIDVDNGSTPTDNNTQNHHSVASHPSNIGFHDQTADMQAPPSYQAVPTAPTEFEHKYGNSGYPV